MIKFKVLCDSIMSELLTNVLVNYGNKRIVIDE